MSDRGVGASIPRKEDDRFLHGRGEFVPDVQLPGMWHAAFRRSQVAHGRLLGVTPPKGAEGQVFTSADLGDVKPIRSTASFPGFKGSDFPVLSKDKVRYVGEQIAIAVAPTRAEAEDIADAIEVECEELPAIHDLNQAREPGVAIIHEPWGDNVFCETSFENGDLDAAKSAAVHTISRQFRLARQTPFPMEGRGACAHYDSRLDELVVWMSHQLPHPMQRGIAEFLGLDINKVRVICPDVGGGFGLKTHLDGETVAVSWVSLKLGRPVKWVQDRFEGLVTDADCREHQYTFTAYTDAVGKILGIDCECAVDAGAYSPWPWPVGVEAATGVGNLQGPYDVAAMKGRSVTVCSNKPPSQPFRGVARPGACFTDELTLDAIARLVGREPWDVRMDNLVKPEQMPYDTVTRKHLDSGDYPEALRRCIAAIDPEGVRARQKTPEPDGRLIGVGFATFYEQTAYGTGPFGYSAWGIELVPGMEMATVKLTPDGGLWASVGIQSHGQGLETTLAQVANSVLGIDPDSITIRHGDTATAYAGTGTYASRSIVVAGGAVAKGCEELKPRLARIGAHLLQCGEDDVAVENGEVKGPGGSVSFAEIGDAFYHHPENLPEDADRNGLTVTSGYNDKVHGGVFGFGAHGAVVAVDPDTGQVEILDYAIVGDCGTLVNPMIVKGQVMGGFAQGIGNALYEESDYDENGQPQSVTLADYHVPAAPMIPDCKYEYMESPSPYSTFGIKGVGESGAIGPVGAIGNAVNDALKHLGVEINETPITPRRLFAAIERGSAS
jgi:carbon-monoxide dehydrogenase large subunit